jgi:hypothetical protein
MARPVSGETVVHLPRTVSGTDAHGNPIYSWPTPGVPIEGASVGRGAVRTDSDPVRDEEHVALTVMLPPGHQIAAVDRMVVRGETFEVVSDSFPWVNPWTQVERGVEVRLDRMEG